MNNLPESLKEWRGVNQFILVKGKVPVNHNYEPVNPHDPQNWMDSEEAINAAKLLRLSVGFVFTDSDPYFFLDIDHCLIDGEWSEVAHNLLGMLPGAAIEISTSGEGLHVFGTVSGEVPPHSCKNKILGAELYTEARFVLLTGDGAIGDVSSQFDLTRLVDGFFPPSIDAEMFEETGPVPDWNGPTDDDVLIAKMLASKKHASNVFGGRATIEDLWENRHDVLSRSFPSLNDRDPYDRSSADAALAAHLAFWTGKDLARMERLMRRSKLVREKWDRHRSYMEMTIRNAAKSTRNVYQAAPRPEGQAMMTPTRQQETPRVIAAATATPVQRSGVQFMSVSQQLEYFKDCVYVRRLHGVFTPERGFMKPEVFKANYAGYTFALDAQNDRTTKNAWEAFIDNQAISWPRVDYVCFRPNLSPRAVIEEEGFTLINGFVPVEVKRRPGDPSPFLNHMSKLFKNDQDFNIVLAYMAAMVQHAGTKFQWCPIIQGAEGNGKTMLFRVVEHAIGKRLTHYPNATDLAGNGLKFNGWIEGKLAVFIEEIYVSDRRELTEPLKVFITNDRIEIQYKGRDQYTGDNLANIMMGTNHKDAMKLSYDQRRYCMIFTAQQNEDDLRRDGMTGRYFPDLYEWLKGGGYEIMAEYLHTYHIPNHLNPATECHRAPKPSNIAEVIEIGLGNIEQHVLDAILEGRQGFRGGYVSSKALDDMLRELRMEGKISPYRRNEIMNNLGYVRHPWLKKGRVDNMIAAEGRKPIIYIKGGPSGPQVSAAAVKADYEVKQGYITPEQQMRIVK